MVALFDTFKEFVINNSLYENSFLLGLRLYLFISDAVL